GDFAIALGWRLGRRTDEPAN
ncbi:hypothetical protein BMB80_RS15575, partial [Escherichia coli]